MRPSQILMVIEKTLKPEFRTADAKSSCQSATARVRTPWHNACYDKSMTHKQHAIALTKPWPDGVSFGSHLRRIIASLKYIVKIPVGYQDENGFHYGEEPDKQDAE